MSWFDPRTGLLAAGVPLPPRRPPNLGQPRDDADLPGPRTTPSMPRYTPQQREALQGLFNQHAQQYPYGRGTAEGEVMSVGPEQFNIRQLNQVLGGPERYSSENVADIPQRPLPPEYVPERSIPLGELQRRWGVPRLEDL